MACSNTINAQTFTEEDNSTEQVSSSPIQPNKYEKKYLLKQRNAFWIANPKMLFTFAATPKSNLYIFGQSLLLLIGFLAFFSNIYYVLFAYKDTVIGVGEVSAQTWADRLTLFASIFIIFQANKHLKNSVHKKPIKGYRLTMFSNSMMRALINQIKLTLLIFAISAVYGLTVYEETALVFSEILDGSLADNIDVFYCLANVTIIYVAFRFCKKELEQ